MTLTHQQAATVEAICNFIASDDRVFILVGYAGTGKTTIIKEVLSRSEEYRTLLMAPTGRAAKILRDRTGHAAATVHSSIYKLGKVEIRQDNDDVMTTEVPLYFPLDTAKASSGQFLCIIDEASMVNSIKTDNEDLLFGSGSMLDDLLEFIHLSSKSKLIFVGDPAQLPPIGETKSNALNPAYFLGKGIGVKESELTEILRQKEGNAILYNAIQLRSLLKKVLRNELVFKKQKGEVEETDIIVATESVCNIIKDKRRSILITYSNKDALMYNRIIHSKLFPESDALTPGDILMSCHNNYFDVANPIFNGDFFELVDISNDVRSRTITLKNKIGGNVCETQVQLEFRTATLKSEDGRIIRANILSNAIDSDSADISPLQRRALYVDFCIRHKYINPKKDKEIFIKELQKDPDFNALRLKYGYAITGHKSQGGEWGAVFVDYNRRNGLNDDCIRWMYTVTTRAKKVLYGIGLPNITPISRLNVTGSIKKINKSPKGYYSDFIVPETPYHATSAPAYLKARYWAIVNSLQGTSYAIRSVESKPYRDIYIIVASGNEKRYDAIYDGNGIFKRFQDNGDTELTGRLNDISSMVVQCQYTSSIEAMNLLYAKMESLCNSLDITITNIIEDFEHFSIRYCLNTYSYEYAVIDFWTNKCGFVTSAIASSSLGEEDLKLKQLVNIM